VQLRFALSVGLLCFGWVICIFKTTHTQIKKEVLSTHTDTHIYIQYIYILTMIDHVFI